jgi:serine/threonine-protein kinase PpkA
MRSYRYQRFILLLSGLFFSLALSQLQAQGVKPLTMAGKTALYQKVLAIPGSKLYTSINGPIDQAGEVKPFSIFYVYDRQDTDSGAWLQVGLDSNGKIDGWLSGQQAIDWKQSLTVSFKDPTENPRVLLFGKRGDLKGLVDQSDAERYRQLRATAETGIPANSPVVAIQPETHTDIRRNFYLVPILDQEDILVGGQQGRMLHVATVPLQEPRPAIDYRAAVVFVIDSTVSMGPYIEGTRTTMARIYRSIESANLSDKVSFGLIAYRDNLDVAPELEYRSRLITDLEQGSSAETFLANISRVRPATVSSQGFNEDAFAGIKQAIEEINWDGYSARYIILITDAGPRAGNDPLSATGMDAEELRQLALDNNIAIWAMHMKTPSGMANHEYAAEQYRRLSQVSGIGDLYYGVKTGDVDSFENALGTMTTQLTRQVDDMARGNPPMESGQVASTEEELDSLQDKVAKLGYALRMRYIQQNRADAIPSLFDAWVIDRDFDDPGERSLDVRVVLTRDQLSDLHEVLKQVLYAAEEGALAPEDFLDDLKSLAATVSRDPQATSGSTRSSGGQSLADLGYMRQYIEDLPYTSEVMTLDLGTWQNWSAQRQFEFMNQLESKIAYYQALHDNVDLWVPLDGGDVDGDALYPLLLEALP